MKNLRKSVDNPSCHDGFGCPVSICRSGFRLQRFRFAIPRRRIGDQRFKKVMRGMGHIIDGTVESFLVCLGGLGETAQLPDELQRRSANFIRRRRWTEVVKCFDGSAHRIESYELKDEVKQIRRPRCASMSGNETLTSLDNEQRQKSRHDRVQIASVGG